MSQIPTLAYWTHLRDEINSFLIDEGQGLTMADVAYLKVS